MIRRNSFVWLAGMALAGLAHADMAWEQYQGGAAHTGYSATALNVGFDLSWQRSFASTVNPVTSTNGTVFVTLNGYFNSQSMYALDSSNGSARWTKDFGSIFSVNPPSYANGIVYVQTGNHASDTYLRGYDARTGDIVFRSPHAAQWERYGAPTIYNGNVYVNGGYYGGAYSFNATTGDQRWYTSLEQYDGWTPAVDATRVITYTGGNLRVLDPGTGAVRMTIVDPGFSWAGWSINTAPVLSGDHAFVSVNGRLSSFDLVNGDIDWSITGTAGALAIDGNELFTIRNGALASLNALTGASNWLWEDPANSSLSGEVIATTNLVLVSSSSKTYVIDRATHRTVQTLNVGGRMSLGEGQLYIASGSNLYAYNVSQVPEPGSWMLMGLGVAALVMRRNMRRGA